MAVEGVLQKNIKYLSVLAVFLFFFFQSNNVTSSAIAGFEQDSLPVAYTDQDKKNNLMKNYVMKTFPTRLNTICSVWFRKKWRKRNPVAVYWHKCPFKYVKAKTAKFIKGGNFQIYKMVTNDGYVDLHNLIQDEKLGFTARQRPELTRLNLYNNKHRKSIIEMVLGSGSTNIIPQRHNINKFEDGVFNNRDRKSFLVSNSIFEPLQMASIPGNNGCTACHSESEIKKRAVLKNQDLLTSLEKNSLITNSSVDKSFAVIFQKVQ